MLLHNALNDGVVACMACGAVSILYRKEGGEGRGGRGGGVVLLILRMVMACMACAVNRFSDMYLCNAPAQAWV